MDDNPQHLENTDPGEPPQAPSQQQSYCENNPQQPGRVDSAQTQEPTQPPPPPQAQQEPQTQSPQQSPSPPQPQPGNNPQQSENLDSRQPQTPPQPQQQQQPGNNPQQPENEDSIQPQTPPRPQQQQQPGNNPQQPENGDSRQPQTPPQPQQQQQPGNNPQQSENGDSRQPQTPPRPQQQHQPGNNPQQSENEDSIQPQTPPQPQQQPQPGNNPQQPENEDSRQPQTPPRPQQQPQPGNNPQQPENEESRQPQTPPRPQQQPQPGNNPQQPENEDSRQPQTPPRPQQQQQPGNNPQQLGFGDPHIHYDTRNTMNQAIEMAQQFKKQELPKSILLDELMELERKARDIVPPDELTEALNDITKTIEVKLNETYEFKGNIFQIGSSVDGSKTGKADEFDYLYVVKLDSLKYRGHNIFHKNKRLNAKEVAEAFMDKIDEIGENLDLTNLCLEHGGFASPSYSGCRRNGPAATLLFYSKAGEYMLISLDFTVAFPLDAVEETKIRLEIAEKAGPLLPCNDKTAEFLKDTLCLVAVEPDKDVWRVSTARLEATFLAELPKDHCLKIAMRYGKILSKKQISDIKDTSNIFYDLGPENVIIQNLAKYKENPTERHLRDLQKSMRLAHYHLTPPQGHEYSELTGASLKLDSAAIKHLGLRVVCQDQPELAKSEGEESAKTILKIMLQELAKENMYKVENYLYEHDIKMVGIAMYAGLMWEVLTCYAKKRCEQFLSINGLASERPPTQLISQQQPQPLHQSPESITDEVVNQGGIPDAYIAGRDSNTSDTVLSQTTTSLDKSQYSGADPQERMNRLVTATKKSRMDKPQSVTELADYVVPFDKRDCPEHTFLVRFTKDELIAKDYPVIGEITNALLNAIGGILILQSTDGELNERELAAWQRSCTDYMERFLSEQIVRSIHFKPLPSGMIMFIPKSQNLMLYNGCIITRSPSGNEHNIGYDSLVDIMNRKSEADHYLQMNPLYGFDATFPHGEGKNREYKHWEVTSFEDIINHISPCPHTRHQRAPQDVCPITPGSNTEHQEAAEVFRQTLLAMANEPCSGEVIIGIAKTQTTFLIKGLHLEDADRGDFEDLIDEVLRNDPVTGEPRVWREPGRFPEKNTHWRVRYHDVIHPGAERRVIARIQIDHYPGGVFEVEPAAYDIDQNGYITQKPFAEWRERMERNIPTIPATGVKTSSRLEAGSIPKAEMKNTKTPDSEARVDDGASYVEAVDPETMNAALMNRKELSWTKDKLNWSERLEEVKVKVEDYVTSDSCFDLDNPLNFTPPKKTVLQRHPILDVKIEEIEKYHQSDRGFVICVESWMSHLMDKMIPYHHGTDLLVFVQKEGSSKGSNFHELHLWVICGTEGDQEDDWRYAIQTSLSLKHWMINGRCPGISVTCHTLHGDNEIHTSGHQEEVMKYLCRKSKKTVELVKKTIAKILFQKDLYFTTRIGNRALINLTEEQAETLFIGDYSQITFIHGPPGSGKTILAMCFAKRYKDPNKVRFVCTTESFRKYISFSVKCESYLVKSRGVEELKKWIKSVIENIECLIFDDVHNLECTKEDWCTILVQLVQSGKYIHLFADPDIQAYKETNSMKALKDAFHQIDNKYGITVYRRQLTEVHRNTRKVTAFIKDAVSASTSPVGIQIKAANSLNGDDIETMYKGGLRLEGADNDLVVLIQDLTFNYPPHDIAVLLGGEKAVEDKIFYTEVLSQHLECKVHGADHNPREGVQVDVVDEYLGLDAPVVIHRNSKPTPDTQIDNPKYRSFIASRGIFRVIFLVEEPLNHHHYEQMNLDRPLKLDAASLQHGKSLDAASTELGESPEKAAAGDLHTAAAAGDVNRVSALLEQGADINGKDGYGRTALRRAAESGKLEVVKLLLSQGADINAVSDRRTALGRAAESGHLEVVKLLLSQGADTDRGSLKPLSLAAGRGEIDNVKCLLQHGADINVVDGRGVTALGRAARSGELEVVKLLLSLDADTERGREKPLSQAAGRGHIDIIPCLLQHGADINAVDWGGYTALGRAAERGELEMVKLLLSLGADKEGGQVKPLSGAAGHGQIDTVQCLLQHVGSGTEGGL